MCFFPCVFGGADCAGSAVRVKGQPDPEADPLSEVFHRAGAPVGCDGGLYNGKSQPVPPLSGCGSGRPGRRAPRDGEILSGDREPIIADRKAGPAGFPGQDKANLTASGAVAQGVGEEIPHHFPEPVPGRR